MKYNSNIHHRRSIRLKGYDYSQAGLYFITLCVQDRLHLFGEIKNEELILNQFGKIIEEEWLKTAKIRKNIILGEYIIMPNHFHAIIQINKENRTGVLQYAPTGKFQSPSNTIGAIIRGFKGAATKKIKEIIYENIEDSSTGVLQYAPTDIALTRSIWQRNYWEHIIRNEKSFNTISEYIINNSKNWNNDKLNKIENNEH